MDFGLSDPQLLLQRSVRDFLTQELPIERVRATMDSDDGFDAPLHRELGEQGVLGLLIPEHHGGSGLGLLDASLVAQELGRAAAPVAFHTAYVLAPLALAASDSSELQAEWLPRIANGEGLVSVALEGIAADQGRLSGTAAFVPDAQHADAFVVVAGGEAFLVPRSATGLSTGPLRTVDDTRRVGELFLEDVTIDDSWRLGDAATSIERAVAAARVAVAADALAAAQQGLRIAVDYAKQREQFGRVIASFQAVKHLCAETLAEVDPVQSLLWYTAWAWDEGLDECAHMVPLLKAHATDTATQAVTTCTQVFGGIGFTHECDMHIYYKRAGYDRQALGGPTQMRRLASDDWLDRAS
jgi:alkylation response protein AidB-like acyl-CoA dehydrogenase